ENVVCTENLCPSQCERQEDCVSRRNVGDWNISRHLIQGTPLRYGHIRSERRTAKRPKINRRDDVMTNVETGGDSADSLQRKLVTLPVAERKRAGLKPLVPGDRERGG